MAGEFEKLSSLKQKFFKLEDFSTLSKGGKPYEWLCTTLLPCVVGWKAWSKQRFKLPISAIATCSDEAFLVLTLENNYSRWISEAKWILENKNKEDHKKAPKRLESAKFTNSGKSKKDGRSKRLQGWAREGYLRFNELYTLVADDRRHRGQFESELLEQVCREERSGKSKKEDCDDIEQDIFPMNDMLGLAAPSKALTGQEESDSESEDGGRNEDSEDDDGHYRGLPEN
jgi:hypothetical protein